MLLEVTVCAIEASQHGIRDWLDVAGFCFVRNEACLHIFEEILYRVSKCFMSLSHDVTRDFIFLSSISVMWGGILRHWFPTIQEADSPHMSSYVFSSYQSRLILFWSTLSILCFKATLTESDKNELSPVTTESDNSKSKRSSIRLLSTCPWIRHWSPTAPWGLY